MKRNNIIQKLVYAEKYLAKRKNTKTAARIELISEIQAFNGMGGIEK